MPCRTQPRGTPGCEIQHKKGDRGVVGCRINLGIYDLLICTSLNLNPSVARLRSSVPPGVILLLRTIEKRCIFFWSSLTAGKCSLHYSSECSWGTGAVEMEWREKQTEGERERTRRGMQGEPKEERVMHPAIGKFVIPPRALFSSSTTQPFLVFPHIVLRKKTASAHKGVGEEAVFMNTPTPTPDSSTPVFLECNTSQNLSLTLNDSTFTVRKEARKPRRLTWYQVDLQWAKFPANDGVLLLGSVTA